MNKIKWNQISENIKLNVPLNLKKKDSYFISFKFDEKIIFSFLEENLFIFNINYKIDEKNKVSGININLCNYIYLSFLNIDELIFRIFQNKYIPNEFLFLTNKRKIYIIKFSNIDYYYEIKIKFELEKNYHILSFMNNIIFIIQDKNLYQININYKRNKTELNNIYSGNKILNCEITENEKYKIIFTEKEIILNNLKLKTNEIIFKDNISFKGFIYENKIIYLKSKDEISVKDIEDNNNNLSLKFNSKKIINKFDFNKVIYSDKNIILVLNSTEIQLYLYNLKTGQFNSESSILENKNILCFENFVLIISISKKLNLKGKICIFNKELNDNERELNIYEKEDNYNENLSFYNFNLEKIEEQFDEKISLNQKSILKIERNKKKINFLFSLINRRNFFLVKEKIKSLLSFIFKYYEGFNLSEYYNYKMDIQYKLIDFFNYNFGDTQLYLNYKEVYLIMIINIFLEKSNNLLNIAQETYDYKVYVYLTKYINNLKLLL